MRLKITIILAVVLLVGGCSKRPDIDDICIVDICNDLAITAARFGYVSAKRGKSKEEMLIEIEKMLYTTLSIKKDD